LQATSALVAVLFGSTLLRTIVPRGDGVYPALLLYEAGLVAIAVFLALRLRSPAGTAVADLVVELGGDVAGTLRDRLATLLSDPSLELGYWTGDGYVTPDGLRVHVPQPGADRSSTLVSLDGGPFAVIVHDRAVLDDPVSVEAVTRATRLSTSNVKLRGRVATAVADIEASSRRLILAADAERDRLAMRLAGGPEQTLAGVATGLADVRLEPGSDQARHLAQSRVHIETAVRDLHEVGRGLRPRELEAGSFKEVLRALASRTPLPVEIEAHFEELPAEVRMAVYYLCAEALSNVSKHAEAERAHVRVRKDGHRLTVEIEDDGVGGADMTRGTGLAGMRDRLEAIGGSLTVASPPNGGTRLVADIPLGGEAH
jgi:signal transduction histidine kinase